MDKRVELPEPSGVMSDDLRNQRIRAARAPATTAVARAGSDGEYARG